MHSQSAQQKCTAEVHSRSDTVWLALNLAPGKLQPAPIVVIRLGPVNPALHSQAAIPAAPLHEAGDLLPAKRTRGKDKQPRGPRKAVKQDGPEPEGRQGKEAATVAAAVAGGSKGSKAGKATGKEKRKRKAVKVERPVLKRSSRKRKAPPSADASPMQVGSLPHPGPLCHTLLALSQALS